MFYKNISVLGRVLYPSLLWRIPTREKVIYLSFDDGPIPEITLWVLSLLKDFNARGTFFCIGDNITNNPAVFKQIIREGHSVGNHSYNHLNGWKTSAEKYIENVLLAEKTIISICEDEEENLKSTGIEKSGSEGQQNNSESLTPPTISETGKLFRPPYGKIKPEQIRRLKNLGYTIVMWDALSGDFDCSLSAEYCFKNVIEVAKPGSIVVFHDSIKASENLKRTLPRVLEYYSERGFVFKGL